MYDVTGNEKNETVVPKKGRSRSPKRNEAQGQSDDVQNMCMQQYRDKMCAQHTRKSLKRKWDRILYVQKKWDQGSRIP